MTTRNTKTVDELLVMIPHMRKHSPNLVGMISSMEAMLSNVETWIATIGFGPHDNPAESEVMINATDILDAAQFAQRLAENTEGRSGLVNCLQFEGSPNLKA